MPEPRDLVPLADIPERFASDPQDGLRQILLHIGHGAVAQSVYAQSAQAWDTCISVPLESRTVVYEVRYAEPIIFGDLVREYAAPAKARAIKAWLHDLTNVVRELNGEPPVPFDQRNRAKSIAAALEAARATPETPQTSSVGRISFRGGKHGECSECFRPNGKHFTTCSRWPEWHKTSTPAVDAFVERVLARQRKPPSSPTEDPTP